MTQCRLSSNRCFIKQHCFENTVLGEWRRLKGSRTGGPHRCVAGCIAGFGLKTLVLKPSFYKSLLLGFERCPRGKGLCCLQAKNASWSFSGSSQDLQLQLKYRTNRHEGLPVFSPLEIKTLPGFASLDCPALPCLYEPCMFSTGMLCAWSMELWWLPRPSRRGSVRGAVPLGLLSCRTHRQEPVCGTCALGPLAAPPSCSTEGSLEGFWCMCLQHETLVWCLLACCRPRAAIVTWELNYSWSLLHLGARGRPEISCAQTSWSKLQSGLFLAWWCFFLGHLEQLEKVAA